MSVVLRLAAVLVGSALCVLNNSTVVGTTKCPGYRTSKVVERGSEIFAQLTLNGAPCNMFSKDIKDLSLHVTFHNSRLRVKIVDSAKQHWEVPQSLMSPDPSYNPTDPAISLLKFSYSENPFTFCVSRKDTGEVIFDTHSHRLVFEEQYLELTSSLPADANIYGIGEVIGRFRRDPKNTIQGMWARDDASPEYENIYGDQPLYIELREGKAHGVHILNSFGMDVLLKDQTVSYKTLGGVLDFSFFAGPTPARVMDQYTATFGRPHQIPYWALGFHQCKYGYKSIGEVAGVVANYSLASIPLETMWTDIEYMDMFKDFTLDPINYPLDKVQAFIKKLHANNQHYILIVDPAIARNDSYPAYLDGLKKDVFIKNPDGSNYVGQVWPGYTVFPDWFAPNTQQWWTQHIATFMNDVPIDGLWIDMNEPSSFCTGSCGSNRTGIPPYPWKDPNYNPDVPQDFPEPNYAIHNYYGNLSAKTAPTNARHFGGVTEFQAHNLYGHMEAIATRSSLIEINPAKRPFVLGRSTFTGSGAYEGHWLGDNHSKWSQLIDSIAGVLSMQMFGIPFVGADICGFSDDTTEELCLRWMQLGSLYPFSRNHNGLDSIPQEPYLWPSVAEASRKALRTRYQLLPFMYTLLEHSHLTGAPVWNALAFEFLDQKNLLSVDRQFLLGRSVLVSPVLEKGASTVNAIFPPGTWFDYHTFKSVEGPKTVMLDAPTDGHMPLHVRGGHILPLQGSALTVAEARRTPFHLIVAFDPITSKSEGELYVDDGESLHVGPNYSSIKFSADAYTISSRGHFGYHSTPEIKNITLLGLPCSHPLMQRHGSTVMLSITTTTSKTKQMIPATITATKDAAFPIISLENIKLPLNGPFTLQL
ncbi:hypothetical protein DSO57_1020094 [Entomophthora muscae]|uniref:Uncharacterized protein n=1 Tax=Entomophthora muscae TaxID=34485 RepID=A0ACC2T3W1_9FUNG|nr:hypothetical protein DSO57_1020094 [Entomophthora muscae]